MYSCFLGWPEGWCWRKWSWLTSLAGECCSASLSTPHWSQWSIPLSFSWSLWLPLSSSSLTLCTLSGSPGTNLILFRTSHRIVAVGSSSSTTGLGVDSRAKIGWRWESLCYFSGDAGCWSVFVDFCWTCYGYFLRIEALIFWRWSWRCSRIAVIGCCWLYFPSSSDDNTSSVLLRCC